MSIVLRTALMTMTVILSGLLSVNAAFRCTDKSEDCSDWKSNMGGNCRGTDYVYMRNNCPVTCALCGEAETAFNEEMATNPTYEPEDSKVRLFRLFRLFRLCFMMYHSL